MDEHTLWNILVREIEVTEGQYEAATNRAAGVGEWLERGGGTLEEGRPRTFVHGSFALGTAIRPIREEGSYDIDVACELERGSTETWTQDRVKHAVGDRLKEHGGYDKLLRKDTAEKYAIGSKRCWTLEYEDRFHLDVLPAVPDTEVRLGRLRAQIPEEREKTALRLTDTSCWPQMDWWPYANPEGYAAWFKYRCGTGLTEGIARRSAELMQPAAMWRVQSPLQDVVKILKRHRDQRMGEHKHKPISIVITTLAGEVFDERWMNRPGFPGEWFA